MTTWLFLGLAFVLLSALVIETLRYDAQTREVSGSPNAAPTPETWAFVDQTPRWMTPFGQVFAPEHLPTFEHVVGMDELVRTLSDLADRALHPLPGRSERHSAVLLWGGRGAGKAILVAALAGEFGARLIHVSARFLVPRNGGTLQPRIAMLVRYAQTNTPSVLFIEDLEMITAVADRDRAQVAIHDLIGELRLRDRRARSLLVATLATPDDLLPSDLVADVFDPVIHVGPPDAAARRALFERAWHGRPPEDIDEIVELTEDMARAEIDAMIKEARERARIEQGPGAATGSRHVRAAMHDPATPTWLQELILSRELWVEVKRLAATLADPDANLGVVLTGDHGTGKTTIARCLATSSQRHLVVCAFGSVADAEAFAQALRDSIKEAVRGRPSLLLLDDCPRIAPRVVQTAATGGRHVVDVSIVAAAVDRALSVSGVAVIATVGQIDAIDSVLRRPGRLDRHVYVSYPDRGARLELLRQSLGPVRLGNISATVVADELQGLTPHEIKTVVADAIRTARRRLPPAVQGSCAQEPVVTSADLWRALQLVTRSAA